MKITATNLFSSIVPMLSCTRTKSESSHIQSDSVYDVLNDVSIIRQMVYSACIFAILIILPNTVCSAPAPPPKQVIKFGYSNLGIRGSGYRVRVKLVYDGVVLGDRVFEPGEEVTFPDTTRKFSKGKTVDVLVEQIKISNGRVTDSDTCTFTENFSGSYHPYEQTVNLKSHHTVRQDGKFSMTVTGYETGSGSSAFFVFNLVL